MAGIVFMAWLVSSILSQAAVRPSSIVRVTASMSVRPFSIRFIALTCLPDLRRLPLTATSDGLSDFVTINRPPRIITFTTGWSQLSTPEPHICNRIYRWIVVCSRSRSEMTPVAGRITSQNNLSSFFIFSSIFQMMRMFHNFLLFISMFSTGRVIHRGERETNTAAYRTPRVWEKTAIFI